MKAVAKKSVKGSKKASKASKMPQKAASSPQTPYRVGSCYQSIIDALLKLGANKGHSYEKIIGAVVLPEGFKSKDKRNENGLGWKKRLIQNCYVLSRKDYGKPCRETLKMEVVCDKEGAGLFKLGK